MSNTPEVVYYALGRQTSAMTVGALTACLPLSATTIRRALKVLEDEGRVMQRTMRIRGRSGRFTLWSRTADKEL